MSVIGGCGTWSLARRKVSDRADHGYHGSSAGNDGISASGAEEERKSAVPSGRRRRRWRRRKRCFVLTRRWPKDAIAGFDQ